MNTFTPAQPARAFQLRQILDVLAGAADEEREIAMHAVTAALHLVGEVAASVTVSGSVFGISNTAVTPPITALRDPVSRSSLCVSPGSRKCTWVSITPGRMCSPLQSMTSPAPA